MFLLDHKHPFEADASRCFLNASIRRDGGFQWLLSLMSNDGDLLLGSEMDSVSFGLYAHPDLGSCSWTELSGRRFEILSESERPAFYFRSSNYMYSEWDNLPSMNLEFDGVRGNEIELVVEGVGGVEAFAEHFPEGKVPFEIRIWIPFQGVYVDVPLDSADAVGDATEQLHRLCPGYSHGESDWHRVSDASGKVHENVVLFAPKCRARGEQRL